MPIKSFVECLCSSSKSKLYLRVRHWIKLFPPLQFPFNFIFGIISSRNLGNLHSLDSMLWLIGFGSSFLKGTHPAQTIFQYVEQQWLAITVLYVFLLRNVIKKRNRLFPKFSRDSVCLKIAYRKRKVYLKTAYRKRKVYLKSAYRIRNLLSNIVPEKNLVLKYCTHKTF